MNDLALVELVEATSRSVKDSLALSDEHGVVLAVNAAYRELYGFTEREVVGRSFAVIFPEDQPGAAEAAYLQAFQRAAPALHRSMIRRFDGADRRVESRITFVERSGGRVAMLSAIRDITVPRPVAVAERPLLTSLDLGELASLYDQYVRSALGYAQALLNDVVQTERVVEDTLLASWRAGLLRERDDSAARLLLFSVLRRYAGEVLLTSVRRVRESGAGPSDSRANGCWSLKVAVRPLPQYPCKTHRVPAATAISSGIAPVSEVLVTGASGFVGRRLAPALVAAGFSVRCLSRNAARAAERWPDLHWVQADMRRADDLARALDGCRVAYYLVHSLGEGSGGLVEREREQAERFSVAAERAGVKHIVYLGGVAPQGPASDHLRSRLEAGQALRTGHVPALELRAAMIVGYGSASWLIVRDLAARLPVMVLPSWLRTRSQPIAIDDVIAALVAAARLPLTASACYDLPGPEILTGRQILQRTARAFGHRRLVLLEVPVLSPGLSSHWVRLVTRADWSVARELVLGLTHDLLARSAEYWTLIGHPQLVMFDEAARRAIYEERSAGHMARSGRALESVVGWLAGGRVGESVKRCL